MDQFDICLLWISTLLATYENNCLQHVQGGLPKQLAQDDWSRANKLHPVARRRRQVQLRTRARLHEHGPSRKLRGYVQERVHGHANGCCMGMV